MSYAYPLQNGDTRSESCWLLRITREDNCEMCDIINRIIPRHRLALRGQLHSEHLIAIG